VGDGSPSDSATSGVLTIEFRVLGPLEVRLGGEPLPLGGPKQRAVLAALLLQHNRVVTTDTLADAVWGEEPPTDYQGSIQVSISALRRSVRQFEVGGRVVIETVGSGYRLNIGEASYDHARFGRLRAAAAELLTGSRYPEAARLLSTALGLWHGRALQDLDRFAFATDFAAAAEEQRLTALQMYFEAQLGAGRHNDIIVHLRELTADFPLREAFWAQLATALYRCGRQAEALTVLRQVRDTLAEDLGVDPGRALQQAERHILRQDDVPEPAPTMLGVTLADDASVDARVGLVPASGQIVPVPAGGLRMGRSTECELVLADDRVSRVHASVDLTPGGATISDLHSTNGSWLNEVRVLGSARLAHGDRIRLGGTWFTVEIEER
jgi:SARP family transcriptional regulator, regulator of embCAB operon